MKIDTFLEGSCMELVYGYLYKCRCVYANIHPKKFTLIDLNMHTLGCLYPLFTCLLTIHELDKKSVYYLQ